MGTEATELKLNLKVMAKELMGRMTQKPISRF